MTPWEESILTFFLFGPRRELVRNACLAIRLFSDHLLPPMGRALAEIDVLISTRH